MRLSKFNHSYIIDDGDNWYYAKNVKELTNIYKVNKHWAVFSELISAMKMLLSNEYDYIEFGIFGSIVYGGRYGKSNSINSDDNELQHVVWN